jgi:hypothetical protein
VGLQPELLRSPSQGAARVGRFINTPRMLGQLFRALLPCLAFDLSSSSGRHDYVDLLLNDLGNLVMWLPFVIVMAVASTSEEAALWGAFGVMTALIALGVYRHRYAPKYAPVFWLQGGQWIGYLAMACVWEATEFSSTLISPISVTVLLVTCMASMVVCQPFTLQFARLKVDDKTAASPVFLTFNYILTSFWLVIFVITVTCSWVAWALHDNKRDWLSPTGYLILGTIVPMALPIFGGLSMGPLSKWLASKAPKAAAPEAASSSSASDAVEAASSPNETSLTIV